MNTCEDFTKAFSNQLRTLRLKKNLSAREMSLSLGQNPNYINLIENEKRLPSIQGVYAICNYLGMNVADFFEFTVTNNIKKETCKNELQNMAKKLTDSQAEAVVQMIKELLKV